MMPADEVCSRARYSSSIRSEEVVQEGGATSESPAGLARLQVVQGIRPLGFAGWCRMRHDSL